MAPVELLPAPRRAAQEQTVLRGLKATTADFKQADPVVPSDPPEATADSKQADPVDPTDQPEATADSKQADPADPLAKTADSEPTDPVDPLAKTADSEPTDPVDPTDPPEATADSEPTDPVDPTEWAEQPRLLVPESPLTDRDPPSQNLLSRSQPFKDRALTVRRPMVLLPVARLPTSHGTLKALDPSTSAAKADSTPSTDPKAANAAPHRI